MLKRKNIFFFFSAAFFCLVFIFSPKTKAAAPSLAQREAGKILLQVQAHGEAWYVNPANDKRYYLGRPADAWRLMRLLGQGISNENLEKIPLGLSLLPVGKDSDGDGLSDNFEKAIGTNPYKKDTNGDGLTDKQDLLLGYNPAGKGFLPLSFAFAQREAGKILLQVQAHGEAWYVNPANDKRYYLGRPADAWRLMRLLGQGISNEDLEKIPAAYTNNHPLFASLEKETQDLINQERQKYNLAPLKWNKNIAAVAREQSQYLAQEDQELTNPQLLCNYPLIHHENFQDGLYQNNRINKAGIYYFGASAENIALIPAIESVIYQGNISGNPCQTAALDIAFKKRLESAPASQKKSIIEEEIAKRKKLLSENPNVEIMKKNYYSSEEIIKQAVTGWMHSPGHRANILNPLFNEAGVGIAEINGYFIITQDFIQRVSCGYLKGPCCQKPGYYPSCYEPLTCRNNICQK